VVVDVVVDDDDDDNNNNNVKVITYNSIIIGKRQKFKIHE
jgi:hypothetical protein